MMWERVDQSRVSGPAPVCFSATRGLSVDGARRGSNMSALCGSLCTCVCVCVDRDTWVTVTKYCFF